MALGLKINISFLQLLSGQTGRTSLGATSFLREQRLEKVRITAIADKGNRKARNQWQKLSLQSCSTQFTVMLEGTKPTFRPFSMPQDSILESKGFWVSVSNVHASYPDSFRFSHYVLDCLGPAIPGVFLVQTSPIDAPIVTEEPHMVNVTDGEVVEEGQEDDEGEEAEKELLPNFVMATLNNNDELKSAMRKMGYPEIEILDLELANPDNPTEKRTISAKMYLPPALVKSEPHKYPLVLHV